MKKFLIAFSQRVIDAKRDGGNDMPFVPNSDINWGTIILEGITEPTGSQSFSIKDGVTSKPLIGYPSTYITFFDDFHKSVASAAPEATWTVTEDDAACTQLLIDVKGGALQLTNKATTDDNAQQIQNQQESFKLESGKKLWFEARVRFPAAVAQMDMFLGLAETEDITGVADNMPANGFGFRKDDGDALIDASSSDNGTNIEATSLATLVTNTFTKFGMYFDGGATGSATIYLYIDGVYVGKLSSVTYATMAELAPIFMVRNGDATTTQILDIDYIEVIQER